MVPRHPFNELKPKSDRMGRNSPELTKRKFCARHRAVRKETAFDWRRGKIRRRLWQRCVPFIIEQMREKFPHIARRIEMPGYAVRAAADGKGETIEIRHDREHRFVGDVVADEKRTSALERFARHQFPHAARLGEP